MPKKRKKKVNPHRIPLAKSAVDKDAILSEATQDDMYRAWLLVVNAIIEQGQIPVKEIPALADTVNKYISSSISGKGRRRGAAEGGEIDGSVQRSYES